MLRTFHPDPPRAPLILGTDNALLIVLYLYRFIYIAAVPRVSVRGWELVALSDAHLGFLGGHVIVAPLV